MDSYKGIAMWFLGCSGLLLGCSGWFLKTHDTLLKIKVLKRLFTAMPYNNHFWFHKEPFSRRFFKE